MPKSDVTMIQLTPEMQKLFDEIPDSVTGRNHIEFTPEEEDLIVFAYPVKNKAELAAAVGRNCYSGKRGVSPGVLTDHYRRLCKERGLEPIIQGRKR